MDPIDDAILGDDDIDSIPLDEMSLDDADTEEDLNPMAFVKKRTLEETPGKTMLCKRQQNQSTPKYVLFIGLCTKV